MASQSGNLLTRIVDWLRPKQSGTIQDNSALANKITSLRWQVTELDKVLTTALDQSDRLLHKVHPTNHASASNLLQYLALRQHDIRRLQLDLSELGLSSLGRSGANIQASVQAVNSLLATMDNSGAPKTLASSPPVALMDGHEILERHADELLGTQRRDRYVRIMVTASTDLATDADRVQAMVEAGMDILRINCAHDDESIWLKMIENLRLAERATGRSCLVLMDLAGPKLRTGPIGIGVPVLKWRPLRDYAGRIMAPANIRITTAVSHEPDERETGPTLAIAPEHLKSLEVGDSLVFTDTRGAERSVLIEELDDAGARATSRVTAYVAPATQFLNARTQQVIPVTDVIPNREQAIWLSNGDTLELTRDMTPGRPADSSGPARIPCTLPSVFGFAQPGEHIWFDDGKIGGIVREVSDSSLIIEITRAREGGSRLRAEKGINLPDTDLQLTPLTDKDLADLPFVVKYADMIGYSFVSRPEDIRLLRQQIAALGEKKPAIILKIETNRAFGHLPEMILESMQDPISGIMIARGDLAVEVGYARLAEVQQEILWIAEAAHVPVIWATQVLENLAKKGEPSRSEITDAAVGERAECVMLNKGPYIIDAIHQLDDILRRMSAHQRKNRAMLRQLHAWEEF